MVLEDFGGESLEKLRQQASDLHFLIPLAKLLGLAIRLTKILGSINATNIIQKQINLNNIIVARLLKRPCFDSKSVLEEA